MADQERSLEELNERIEKIENRFIDQDKITFSEDVDFTAKVKVEKNLMIPIKKPNRLKDGSIWIEDTEEE